MICTWKEKKILDLSLGPLSNTTHYQKYRKSWTSASSFTILLRNLWLQFAKKKACVAFRLLSSF